MKVNEFIEMLQRNDISPFMSITIFVNGRLDQNSETWKYIKDYTEKHGVTLKFEDSMEYYELGDVSSIYIPDIDILFGVEGPEPENYNRYFIKFLQGLSSCSVIVEIRMSLEIHFQEGSE